jgi:hypothetical protein
VGFRTSIDKTPQAEACATKNAQGASHCRILKDGSEPWCSLMKPKSM